MALQKHIDTQNKIIEIAKKLFREYGYEKTSIRMIVREMGLKSAASFYQFFESKEALVSNLINAHTRRKARQLEPWLKDTDELVRCIVNFCAEDWNRLYDAPYRRWYAEISITWTLPQMFQIHQDGRMFLDGICEDPRVPASRDELRYDFYCSIKGDSYGILAYDRGEVSLSLKEILDRKPEKLLRLCRVGAEDSQKILEEVKEIIDAIPDSVKQNLDKAI